MTDLVIRPYAPTDQDAVRALFIAVNRELAPPDMRDAFERYIARSLTGELDRIGDYYAEHGGCFMIATLGGQFAGMFGLERSDRDAMELRRQPAALALYRSGGFTETHSDIAKMASNKPVGGGLRRFHFEKRLR